MDECISPVPDGDWIVNFVPAEAVLDRADQELGGKGDLVFKLNFRVSSSSDSRTTNTLIAGRCQGFWQGQNPPQDNATRLGTAL